MITKNIVLKEQLKQEQIKLFLKSKSDYYITILLSCLIISLSIPLFFSPITFLGLNLLFLLPIFLVFTVRDLREKKFEYKFNRAMLIMLLEFESL